ncbi:hypothetical protein E1B28_008183 [Marasmius oreades]|uniref:Uncharacterized protein n=1 Tax=Marasmius oreades TaxID=181124 RepID=A0A9P7RYH4_9AGAR|nr:uncharacterized protein E1B28_008183 [Marasmius oreades]KAG7091780.1 hypothetical protein E1B28_008183 [Marasmius oreades]
MMATQKLLIPPTQAAQPPRKRKQKQLSSQRQKLGAAAEGTGGVKVAVDAITYLDQIKETYCEEPDVYREFLGLMQDFKSARTTVTQTITRVAVLFRSHTELYEGFNSFLPPGYGIVPSPSRDGKESEVEVVITTPDGVERRVFR